MIKNTRLLLGSAFLLAATPLALHADSHEGHSHDAEKKEMVMNAPLIANLTSTEGNKATGTLTFMEAKDGKGITIHMKVSGLKPNAKHAIHIHEFGDISAADGTSTGGHYNPEGHDHGLTDQEMRHAGDLGNLEANDKGVADQTITVTNISLINGKNPIVGRGIVVHVAEDKGTQPTGDAGARISVGVIGVMQKAE